MGCAWETDLLSFQVSSRTQWNGQTRCCLMVSIWLKETCFSQRLPFIAIWLGSEGLEEAPCGAYLCCSFAARWGRLSKPYRNLLGQVLYHLQETLKPTLRTQVTALTFWVSSTLYLFLNFNPSLPVMKQKPEGGYAMSIFKSHTCVSLLCSGLNTGQNECLNQSTKILASG